MKRFRVGLVGAGSCVTMEMLRLIAGHPRLTLTRAASLTDAGKTLAEVYPFLQHIQLGDVVVCEPQMKDLAKACDLVFLTAPHGSAMDMAAQLLALKTKVVDFSADFRLKDKAAYEEYYKTGHSQPDLLKDAVYGLPEINASNIRRTRLTANPGSCPTASLLALLPALRLNLLKAGTIIIDAKSAPCELGFSGQGLAPCTACRPAGAGPNRHIPELLQEIQELGKKNMSLLFTPHLIPVNRGTLVTIYAPLRRGIEMERVRSAYEAGFRRHKWLRLLPEGVYPDLLNVRGSMYCDVAINADKKTGILTVMAAIDNLCRGAAGQALANANLMLGMPMDIALRDVPLAP